VDRRKILIETQNIVNLRIRFGHKYLQILKENERKFVCRDETWVYQNGSQVRQWLIESNRKGVPTKFKSEGKRFTILSAGCDQGFLPGCDIILDTKVNDRDYHKTTNGDVFKKWVKDQLVPALSSLKIKCAIVMDNAPYHSVKINKPPTTSSRKEDIKNWLSVKKSKHII
jgi:hypothetical protein